MKQLTFVLLLLSVSILPVNGHQAPKKTVIITGKVLHKSTEQPLEYATVAFLKDNGEVAGGGITTQNGTFSIEIPAGIYTISTEFIGFKPEVRKANQFFNSKNIGIILLEEDATLLGEVEIVAERTTVELHLDKKIYNVGRDLTVSGGSVSDVLDNVPSVSVDVEGNVALRGNDNVRILINGKPSGLAGLNSSEGLRQLPAEAVQKIEVITSPSARYDAEGTAGILNIILRRSKMQGFNGALTTNFGYPLSAGVSANLNYRVGDFNFFTTSGYRYGENNGYSKTATRYFNKKQDSNTGNSIDFADTYMNEYNKMDRNNKGFNTNFGVEWYLNNSTSVTLSALFKDSDSEQERNNHISQFDANRVLTAESRRIEDEEEDDKGMEYSFNLTKNFNDKGHKLTIDAQYEDNKEVEDAMVAVNKANEETVRTDEKQKRYLLQADYVLPLNEKSQFEVGYRGNFSDRNTDYQVALWNGTANDFILDKNVSNVLGYKENINAIYSQYGNKIGDKFTYLLGLRFEHTQIEIAQETTSDYKKKDYSNLFPTVNLSYAFSENQSVTLGYARRIRRPRSRMINPFPSRSSLTSVFQGNADIDPSYSGTFDLGYLNRFGKMTLSSSIYYQHATDVFNLVSFDTGTTVVVNGKEVPVIRRTPINLSENDRWGFETTLNFSPSRKWRIDGNINIFKSITKGSYNGSSYDADDFSWFARLSNKYTLPGNIEWQTRIMYRGPQKDAQNQRKGMIFSSTAFSKDLFQEKASISLSISDLFDTHKRNMETTTPTYYSDAEFQWRGRSFNLSFTYRFNQKKKRGMRGRTDDSTGDNEFF